MTDSNDKVLDALQTLLSVFTNLGRTAVADYVREILQLYESRSTAFATKFANPNMWGPAGSVADNLPPEGSPDQDRFLNAMIILADYMNESGMGSPMVRRAAASVASTFRQWLSQGR